jgi:hypothetical protein
MQKINKLNFLLHKSNNFNYGHLLLNKNIILTLRSDLYQTNTYSIKKFEKLLVLHNNKRISYTSFRFLLNKTSKKITSKSDYSFLKTLTELSWESGILVNNKKRIKSITFTKF